MLTCMLKARTAKSPRAPSTSTLESQVYIFAYISDACAFLQGTGVHLEPQVLELAVSIGCRTADSSFQLN